MPSIYITLHIFSFLFLSLTLLCLYQHFPYVIFSYNYIKGRHGGRWELWWGTQFPNPENAIKPSLHDNSNVNRTKFPPYILDFAYLSDTLCIQLLIFCSLFLPKSSFFITFHHPKTVFQTSISNHNIIDLSSLVNSNRGRGRRKKNRKKNRGRNRGSRHKHSRNRGNRHKRRETGEAATNYAIWTRTKTATSVVLAHPVTLLAP